MGFLGEASGYLGGPWGPPGIPLGSLGGALGTLGGAFGLILGAQIEIVNERRYFWEHFRSIWVPFGCHFGRFWLILDHFLVGFSPAR